MPYHQKKYCVEVDIEKTKQNKHASINYFFTRCISPVLYPDNVHQYQKVNFHNLTETWYKESEPKSHR